MKKVSLTCIKNGLKNWKWMEAERSMLHERPGAKNEENPS